MYKTILPVLLVLFLNLNSKKYLLKCKEITLCCLIVRYVLYLPAAAAAWAACGNINNIE